MNKANWAVAALCGLMLLVVAYAFWIGSQKTPSEGGPVAVSG